MLQEQFRWHFVESFVAWGPVEIMHANVCTSMLSKIVLNSLGSKKMADDEDFKLA